MEREKIIEYLRKEVRCDKSKWSECSNYKRCVDCPNNFPVPLIKVIQAALELIEQDGWIPVAERLPETSDLYTVTDRMGNVVRYIFTGTDSSKRYWKRNAKAWRPIPKPYTEEES